MPFYGIFASEIYLSKSQRTEEVKYFPAVKSYLHQIYPILILFFTIVLNKFFGDIMAINLKNPVWDVFGRQSDGRIAYRWDTKMWKRHNDQVWRSLIPIANIYYGASMVYDGVSLYDEVHRRFDGSNEIDECGTDPKKFKAVAVSKAIRGLVTIFYLNIFLIPVDIAVTRIRFKAEKA
jgi:hypothetical protein